MVLSFIKPLVKTLFKPWILVFIALKIVQIFYPSWILWCIAQSTLLYGST
jgi:hypothetical protein